MTQRRLGLKAVIVGAGKTQRELSLDTRIPETRLSAIVCGAVDPTDPERAAIATALRMPADVLFSRDSTIELRSAR